MSLTARRAWIEITIPETLVPRQNQVALRKESVDRNLSLFRGCYTWIVALRKESVDRNADGVVSGSADYVSLSARRAWIEMM